MNRIDFDNLGGFPLDQDTLKFLQSSYTAALGAIARLCGEKSILYGVEVNGGSVSAGWITYNGEMIPFLSGPLGSHVVISEVPTSIIFEDDVSHNVEFTKVATSGIAGDFPLSELVPLLSFQYMWQSGDIKEKYCDAAYITDNFDVDGYGINREKGWRRMDKAIPASAGKVFVNLDEADPDFDTVGETIGAKTHIISIAEMPAHTHTYRHVSGVGGGGDSSRVGTANDGTATGPQGGNQAHNNVQPPFVILKLIKL